MLTLDEVQGIATDHAVIYRGTEEEPDEDGTPVSLTMQIGDDLDELILTWVSGPHRTKTEVWVPLERLAKIIKAAE